MHFAGGTAGHGEILTGEMNQAAIDGGAAGDDSIRRQILASHVEISGAVFGEKPHFLKAVSVDEIFPRAREPCKLPSACRLSIRFSAASLLGSGSLLGAQLGDLFPLWLWFRFEN